jgi:hypothetical protein
MPGALQKTKADDQISGHDGTLGLTQRQNQPLRLVK